MNIKIRYAKPEDAKAIAQAHINTWQTVYKDIIPQSYLDDLSVEKRTDIWADRIIPSLEENKEILLVIEVDNLVVGFSHAGPARDDDVTCDVEIYSLYLIPDHWDKGLGDELLSTTVQQFKEREFKVGYLMVLEDNMRARRFYERSGMVQIDKVKHLEIEDVTLNEVAYGFKVA